MILLETIKNKLEKHIGYEEIYKSFDCRYMKRYRLNNDYLGYSHFKWNHRAHTLNQKELKHLKEYFKL